MSGGLIAAAQKGFSSSSPGQLVVTSAWKVKILSYAPRESSTRRTLRRAPWQPRASGMAEHALHGIASHCERERN